MESGGGSRICGSAAEKCDGLGVCSGGAVE